MSLVRLSGVLLDSWSSPLIIGGGAVLMLADVEKWVVCGGVRLQGGKCRGLNREVESEEWEIAVESRETPKVDSGDVLCLYLFKTVLAFILLVYTCCTRRERRRR